MASPPVMRPGGSPKGKRLPPCLNVKLRAGWRFDASANDFVAPDGQRFRPRKPLPANAKVVAMVPHLAAAVVESLSEDERDLADYVQIMLPGADGDRLRAFAQDIADWPCVEHVRMPPEISLPGGPGL